MEDTLSLSPRQDCHPSACRERTAYCQVSWCTRGGMSASCEAEVEVFCAFASLNHSNLERMILEAGNVYFYWCHLVHWVMTWKTCTYWCLQGQCIIPKYVLVWPSISLGHWLTEMSTVQTPGGGIRTWLWHTGLFRATRSTHARWEHPIIWVHSPLAPPSVLRFTLYQLFIDLNNVAWKMHCYVRPQPLELTSFLGLTPFKLGSWLAIF